MPVFTAEALARLRGRDEPATAAEAELAGPWRVSLLESGAYGIFRHGEEEAGAAPFAVIAGWHLALLVAAALPAIGAAASFALYPERGERGYPLLRVGVEVGAFDYFVAEVASALGILEAVIRSPTALALLLEAAGPTALEHAGRELGLRLASVAPDESNG